MMGVALISVLAIAACGQQPEDKDTNQVSVYKNADAAQLKPNFKLVGENNVGYVQIPNDFAITPNKVPNTTQYIDADQTFIVTSTVGDGAVPVEESIENVTGSFSGIGEEAQIKDVIIGSYEAKEVYKSFLDSDYYAYAYLFEDEGKVKVLTLEFSGEQADLKDEILSTFSLDKPNF